MHNETNPYLELGDIELKKAEVRILRSGLRIGSILALAVLIGYQFTIFPAQTVFTMSILTAALGGMMLSIYWWLGKVQESYKYVNICRFLILCWTQASCLFLTYIWPTPYSFASILIFIVISGSNRIPYKLLVPFYLLVIPSILAFIVRSRMTVSPQEVRSIIALYSLAVSLAFLFQQSLRNMLNELVQVQLAEAKRNHELEKTQEQLEAQKQELTTTVQALERAKLLAEGASRAKSNFLAMMSHEIRTPMNGVMGMANLLAHSELHSEHREYVEIIRSSGESLLAIINDILDFSKVEAESLRLDSAPFQLSKTVEDVIDLFRPLAIGKELHLSYQIAPEVPTWVNGDANRLKQILMNLINNAIKFTERGRVTLSVDIQSKSIDLQKPDESTIHFAVKDSGIGVPNEKHTILFEPFNQLDSSTTRKYGGTGLGLAIGKRLSELMGGTMWHEDNSEGGSTFHFFVTLQLSTTEQSSVASQLNSKTQDANQRNDSLLNPHFAEQHPLRILIAEDNIVNQKVALRLLEKLGYQADVVVNGALAVTAVTEREYDIILMDVQMPEMDGLDATRTIRSEFLVTKSPRIVAMTAATLPEEVEMIYESGMDAYLSKPVRIDALVQQLKLCHEANQLERGRKNDTASTARPFRGVTRNMDRALGVS
jgi:signal transduction histidine kinase/AmiR/NasT family two-component response regulator